MNPESRTAFPTRAALSALLRRSVMRSVAVAGIAVAFSALLAACSAQPAATSSAEAATPVAAPSAPVDEPTTGESTTGESTTGESTTGADTDWLQMASVDGDRYLLGNPAAPVRIIDYSDFL